MFQTDPHILERLRNFIELVPGTAWDKDVGGFGGDFLPLLTMYAQLLFENWERSEERNASSPPFQDLWTRESLPSLGIGDTKVLARDLRAQWGQEGASPAAQRLLLQESPGPPAGRSPGSPAWTPVWLQLWRGLFTFKFHQKFRIKHLVWQKI